MRTHVNIRVRKKDQELRDFIESLDPSVDVSDAVRTCALWGIRNIGDMFPKQSAHSESANNFAHKDKEESTNNFAPNKEMFKKKEPEDDDIETLGDNLIKSLI